MKWFDWVALVLITLTMLVSFAVGLPFWRWQPSNETSLEFAIGLRLSGGFALLVAYYFVRSVVFASVSEYRAGLSRGSRRE